MYILRVKQIKTLNMVVMAISLFMGLLSKLGMARIPKKEKTSIQCCKEITHPLAMRSFFKT